jgi:hypothetical protein
VSNNGQNGPGAARIAKAPIVCQSQTGAQVIDNGKEWPGAARIAKAPIVCQSQTGAQVIDNGKERPGAARIAKALIVCQPRGVRVAHNGGDVALDDSARSALTPPPLAIECSGERDATR